jgi:hypothetical protein
LTETENETLIPCDCNATDEQLTSLGFVLGPKILQTRRHYDHDQEFREARYPDGWGTQSGGFDFDRVIDDRGRCRALLYYGLRNDCLKGGVVEADSFLRFLRRITVKIHRLHFPNFGDPRPTQVSVVVRDAGRPVRCFGTVEYPKHTAKPGLSHDENRRLFFGEADAKLAEIKSQAYAWLREHYPGHESWQAHWDDPIVEPDESV